MMLSYILFVTFVLLQIADVWTTHYIISRGIGIEANPIMSFWIKKMGLVFGLLVPKVIVISLVVTFIPQGQYGYVAIGLLIALYACVIGNNVKVLRKTNK